MLSLKHTEKKKNDWIEEKKLKYNKIEEKQEKKTWQLK